MSKQGSRLATLRLGKGGTLGMSSRAASECEVARRGKTLVVAVVVAAFATCMAGALVYFAPAVPSYTEFSAGEPGAVLEGGGPGAWDERVREKVQVIEEDGTFKMWYVGHRALSEHTARVGYATSDDGRQWSKHSGNPILDRGSQDEDICVVRVSRSIYYMYVEVNDSYIDLLYSFDGLDWRLHPDSPVRRLAASPVVWMDGDVWFMLYERMVKEPNYSIYLAMSADGITWVDHPNNPVLVEDSDVVPDSVVKSGSSYQLYYHQKVPGQDVWPAMHAMSVNLTTWTDRKELMHDYSSQYTVRRANGEVWSYIWHLVGDQKYYLRYGREAGPFARWSGGVLR